METGAERGQMCLGPLSLSGRGSGSTRTTNPGAGGTNRLAWGVRDLLARSSGSWGAILTQLTLQRQQPRVKSNKSSTSAAPPLINLSSVPTLGGRHYFSLTLLGLRLAPNSEKTKTNPAAGHCQPMPLPETPGHSRCWSDGCVALEWL